MDSDGTLQDGADNAAWLHGMLDKLPPAARWDLKEALGYIREFNLSVRILKNLEANHGTSPDRFIVRRLP